MIIPVPGARGAPGPVDNTAPFPGSAPVRYVSGDGSNSNDGRLPGRAFRDIQAALDNIAGPGKVIVLPSPSQDYAPFATDSPGVEVEGWGAPGQDTQTGLGPVRIRVGSGQHGAQLAVTAAGPVFAGSILRNLHFVGAAGALSGVRAKKMSNFIFDRVSCSDFLTVGSRGFYVEGDGAAQYGTLRDCLACDCNIGVEAVDHNGLEIFGGFIENLTGSAVVPAGTKGVIIGTASDNARIFGLRTQFLETCYDITGEGAEIIDGRCEAFTTGVEFRGPRGVLRGGYFINQILGGSSGTAVRIEATASRTHIFPFHYASLTTCVDDLSAGAARYDGVPIDVAMDVSAAGVTSFPITAIGNFKGVDSYNLRRGHFRAGSTPIPASATDYWTVSVKTLYPGGTEMTLNSQLGWAGAGAVLAMPTLINNALLSGSQIRVDYTKTGSPPNLTNASVHAILLPYPATGA